MARSKRAVLTRDLVIAVSNVTVAVTTAGVVGGLQVWPLGAVMFGFSTLLFAAADRSSVGDWTLGAALSAAVVVSALALWWLVPGSPFAVSPPLLFGLGVGTAVNRLLFGVVYPLPEARLRRENLT